MKSIRETVGRNIYYYRKERKFSQEKLAVRAGLSAEYISRVENGKKDAKITTLEKIANALKIEPFRLLLRETDQMVEK